MTPFVPDPELVRRHQELFRLLPANSALLVLGNETRFRNRDVEYPFRQESSFWYLSRFNEPDAALLFVKGETDVLSIIFSHEYNRDREIWSGSFVGTKEARRIALSGESFPVEKLPELLEKYLGQVPLLYFDPRRVKSLGVVKKIIEASGVRVEKAEPLIAKLRLFKSNWELGEIRKAAEVSTKAFRRVEEFLGSSPRYEYEVAAEISHIYELEGLTHAYPPIVASGQNATVLHYVKNSAKLSPGLLLIDSGAEYNYYAADITRMFVVDELRKEEKDLSDAVKTVQGKVLSLIATPKMNLRTLHEKSTELITEALLDLKLLEGSFAECMEHERYKKFFMHGIGHWLGLDVHDIGPSSREGTTPLFAPGMCFTVEPGIYCDPNDHTIPEGFRGIGVRIEDDVAVTESGVEVLTSSLAK